MMSRTCISPHLEHAFDHGERLRIHQVALFRVPQDVDQLLAILRFSAQYALLRRASQDGVPEPLSSVA